MSFNQLFLILTTLIEVVLLIGVVIFFVRLKRSESLVRELYAKQDNLLKKLSVNAQIEQQLMDSFKQRQEELTLLDKKLAQRSAELNKLLKQAEGLARSPEFLRQSILAGHKRGQSIPTLAKNTGLSEDEVRLIVEGQGAG